MSNKLPDEFDVPIQTGAIRSDDGKAWHAIVKVADTDFIVQDKQRYKSKKAAFRKAKILLGKVVSAISEGVQKDGYMVDSVNPYPKSKND